MTDTIANSENIAGAEGCIAVPMEQLRLAMESTEEFAKFKGNVSDRHKVFHFNVEEYDQADQKEFHDSKAERVKSSRPLILLTPDYPNAVQWQYSGSNGWAIKSGTIQAVMEKNISDFGKNLTSAAALRFWDVMIGKLLDQTFYAGWDSGLIDITRIHTLTLGRSSTKDRAGKGEYLGATFKVDWGVTGQ